MSSALAVTNDLPIRHTGSVHDGKVRSVYWFTPEDSQRVAEIEGLKPKSTYGAMVISDRISAFDANWTAEGGLDGIPYKGAALNAISEHWFEQLSQYGIGNHIRAKPHPLVWIVEKANPIMVEGVFRMYITGSMWRAYEKTLKADPEIGWVDFCGNRLPIGLHENQKLPELIFTPTTKGTILGVDGIAEQEDAKLDRKQLKSHYDALGFNSEEDIAEYEWKQRLAYAVISESLMQKGLILVDSKFETGYIINANGMLEMILIDELVTPDSSRIWDKEPYETKGIIVQGDKEVFRQELLSRYGKDILLQGDVVRRRALAASVKISQDVFAKMSGIYQDIAHKITGKNLLKIEKPRQEIIDILQSYGVIEVKK